MAERTTSQMIEHHIVSNPVSVTILRSGEEYIAPALRAVSAICRDGKPVSRVIVVAAKKTIEDDWLVQIRRDPSLQMLSYAPALGKAKRKQSAFFSGRKVILTNDESLSWMEGMSIREDDILVIDELSRYRNRKTDRYRIIKKITRMTSRVIAFSRLPIPHGLNEIWEEISLLDDGARLGRTKAAFLDRYFFVNRIWTDGHMKIYTTPKENATESISNAIKDICLDLSNEDSKSDALPRKRNVYLELSRSELSRYILMSRELMLAFGDNTITASDTSAVTGKLLQLASGTVYDDKKEVIHFHKRKIDALKRLLKEYDGSNVLVAYWFKHELEHIMSEIPEARPILSPEDMEDWNNGIIHVGLINSSMGGHLGDLSVGGNILIWFSLTWSLSLYARTNSRIVRDDCVDSLIIHLIASNTIDEAVLKILDANRKDNSLLLEAVRSHVQ